MNRHCAILGTGAWGTAIATTLSGSGRSVTRWNRSTDDHDLRTAEILVIAVPAQQTRTVLTRVRDHIDKDATLILTAKGLETQTLLRQSQIAADVLPDRDVAILSGPGFAADLIAGLPTALTLATRSPNADALQAFFATRTLRPYLTDDLVGTELGGALKNVIAIACGLVIGAGLGESARAAVMTRGFTEIIRLATALGATEATLSGLSGLGDLMLTSTSLQSRNYRYGVALGRQDKDALTGTIEGHATADAALSLALKTGQDTPIIAAVAQLTRNEIGPDEAITKLFNRPLKRERS